MAQPQETLDEDFDAQLRGLFQQAERALEHRNEAEPGGAAEVPDLLDELGAGSESQSSPEHSGSASSASLPQALRPLVQGLEAIVRATSDNTTTLQKLESAAAAHKGLDKDLPQIVAELRSMLDLKNGVNQGMFAALHEELKGYKDGFLLESVHRPIIRDLISLYDDTFEIQRQAGMAAAKCAEAVLLPLGAEIRTLEMNIDHNVDFLIEILARLEVTLLEQRPGKLDKRTQRVVAVEHAEDPNQDGDVVRVAKRGFVWQTRVFRPEEVVIRKWKDGFLVALQPGAQT